MIIYQNKIMKRVWILEFLLWVNFGNGYNINSADPEIIDFDQSYGGAWCGYDFDVSNDDIIVGCPKESRVLECEFGGKCDEIYLGQDLSGYSDCWRLFGTSNCHNLGDFWGASIARDNDKMIICAPFKTTRDNALRYDGSCAQYQKYNQNWYFDRMIRPDTGSDSMIGMRGFDVNEKYSVYSAPRRVDEYPTTNNRYQTGSFRIGRNDCSTLDYQCTAQPGPLQHFFPDPPLGPISRSTADSNTGYSIKLFHVGKGAGVLDGVLVGAPSLPHYELSGRVLVYGTNGDRYQILDGSNIIENNIGFDFYFDSSSFDGGNQFGERFGSALAVGDFNGDGLIDIAVGAPGWSRIENTVQESDLGRVYIFKQNSGFSLPRSFNEDMKKMFESSQILSGISQNGNFGQVLASNGDLDNDGFDDLVVSSPNENGEGRVYIFNGSPSGLHKEPSQVIKHSGVKWFGHQIKFNADIDGNGYQDLVISAPGNVEHAETTSRSDRDPIKSEYSGTVFAYKTRPSLSESIKLEVTDEPVIDDIEDIRITVCGSFDGAGVNRELPLIIRMYLDADSARKRLLIEGHSIYEERWVAIKAEEKCFDLVANVQWQFGPDRMRPIVIRAEIELQASDNSNDSNSPIVNPYSQTSTSKQVQLWKNCGADNICSTDLQLKSMQSAENQPVLLVDMQSSLSQRINLEVIGELSYDTKLYISRRAQKTDDRKTFLSDVSTNGNKLDCKHLVHRLPENFNEELDICSLQNPMEPGVYPIEINFKILPDGETNSYPIRISVNNTNINVAQDELEIVTNVELDTKLNVFSEVLVSDYIDDSDKISQSNHLVLFNETYRSREHSFSVIASVFNRGPITVKSSTMAIRIPVKTSNGDIIIENWIELTNLIMFDPPYLQATELLPDDGSGISHSDWKKCEILNPNELEAVDGKSSNASELEYVYAELRCYLGRFSPSEGKISLEKLILSNKFINRIDTDFTLSTTFQLESKTYPYKLQPFLDFRSNSTSHLTIHLSPIAKAIPWWIILLPILLVILILSSIAYICYKNGVFGEKKDIEPEQHKAFLTDSRSNNGEIVKIFEPPSTML